MPQTFGAETTADEVLEGVDLTGWRILITGVSAGLGVETARAFAAHGADIVGAARDLAKARGPARWRATLRPQSRTRPRVVGNERRTRPRTVLIT